MSEDSYVGTPVYYVTAPTVILPKLTPRTRLLGIFGQNPGSAGNLVLNDCASLDQASIQNQILTFPYTMPFSWIGSYGALSVPLLNGLVVSSVPTGGIFTVYYESLYIP